ncbi:MAG: hypothetical protein R3E66_05665 [bacterium]
MCNRLLAHFIANMTPARLRAIATGDYGQDVDAHLAALHQICAQGTVPAHLKWHPREVLELMRWSEPARKDVNWGHSDVEIHWMRGFACATLLLQLEPSDYEVTLANLLVSVAAVCPSEIPKINEVLDHLEQTQLSSESEKTFVAAARLWVALETSQMDRIDLLIQTVLERDAVARAEYQGGRRSIGFAGTTSLISSCGWHAVGVRMADLADALFDPELRFFVGEISRELQEIRPKNG